jgi:hypothetical protein
VRGILLAGDDKEDVAPAKLSVAKLAMEIGQSLEPILLTRTLSCKVCPRLRVFLECDRFIRSDDFALEANSLFPQIPGQLIRCDMSIVRIADLGLEFQKQPLLLQSIAFGVVTWIVERLLDQNAGCGYPQHFTNYYLPVIDMMQGFATQRPIKMAVGEIKLSPVHTSIGDVRTAVFLPATLQQWLGNVDGCDSPAIGRQLYGERTATTADVEDIIWLEPLDAVEQRIEVSQSQTLSRLRPSPLRERHVTA